MNMKEFLSKLVETKSSEEVVSSTHPMTEEQIVLWKALRQARVDEVAAETVAKNARKRFWNKVEFDLDNFNENLQVDEQTMSINVMGEEKKENKD